MPCFLCNEEHLTRKCPTLWEDKKEGFYSGGGTGEHSHDDEENELKFSNINMIKDV